MFFDRTAPGLSYLVIDMGRAREKKFLNITLTILSRCPCRSPTAEKTGRSEDDTIRFRLAILSQCICLCLFFLVTVAQLSQLFFFSYFLPLYGTLWEPKETPSRNTTNSFGGTASIYCCRITYSSADYSLTAAEEAFRYSRDF